MEAEGQSAWTVIVKKVANNNNQKTFSIKFCDFSENKFILSEIFGKILDKLEKCDKIN